MTITLNNGKEGRAQVMVSNKLCKEITTQYPEMSMMLAMEELSELSQAISKCVRNGSSDKKDNLAEEIVDVLIIIQWLINRFDIPLQAIQKWAHEKEDRLVERNSTDEVIFRTTEAKENYGKSRSKTDYKDNQLIITDTGDGQYEIVGDQSKIPEYYHVLKTLMIQNGQGENIPTDLDDIGSIFDDFFGTLISAPDKEEKKSKKMSKKASKDLDKSIEKATKKKESKKDDKKGKKGKK